MRFDSRRPTTINGSEPPVDRNVLPLFISLAAVSVLFVGMLLMSPGSNLEVFGLLFLVIPAYALALRDSKALVPYILFVWAFGPEVRRVFEWAQGAFQPVSIISIAPVIATAALFFPITRRPVRLTGNLRKAMAMFLLALTYGGILGLFRNGLPAMYDLLNYAVPLALILYAASRPLNHRERENWVSWLIIIATGVAIYGWVQFLLAPPWDTFWMRSLSTKLESIGLPKPMMIRMFSTMNAPAVTATFLAAALAPLLTDKRFRGPTGWLAIAIIGSASLITFVRAIWVMLPAFALAHVSLSSAAAKWKAAAAMVVAGLAIYLIIPILPGGAAIMKRIETVQNIGGDRSYNARQNFVFTIIPTIAANPLGNGLGYVGVGSKLSTSNSGATQMTDFDNGFLATYISLGLLGGTAFFTGLYYMVKAVLQSARRTTELMDNARLGLGALAFLIVSLLFSNNIPGLGSLLTWLFVAMAVQAPARQLSAPAVPRRLSAGAPSNGQAAGVGG